MTRLSEQKYKEVTQMFSLLEFEVMQACHRLLFPNSIMRE